jgi:hypothetical protein
VDIFTAFGLSVSAGLNAYIPLLVVALIARFTHWIELNPPWDSLSSWWIIAVLILLSTVEFFADKIPAVNHINDIFQTIVRPVAGAIVFTASSKVISEIHPVLAMAAGLLVAGGVHAAKAAAVRPAVTATTGGTGNILVSIFEDFLATVFSILAVVIPVLIAVVVVLLTSWLILKMWQRANRKRFGDVG